ncbi:hypothetical protein Agabi119p4_2566 [Agaricus bisporus var. burnettii]|uniref:Uncharacterized protein n=1 Tax=Agaricus bisporus var. burnettii TaxID=192524 RepID=A0A8H7F9I9_AGABI|nr:hypothetical protein Agabi119p4_2566 [Agaricus bisporus var. burnettii]
MEGPVTWELLDCGWASTGQALTTCSSSSSLFSHPLCPFGKQVLSLLAGGSVFYLTRSLMVSQQDGSQAELAPAVDGDWHIAPADWWRTPIYSASWSYKLEEQIPGPARIKPPCYCLPPINGQEQNLRDLDSKKITVLSEHEWPPSSAKCRIAEEEDDGGLNEQLVGVQSAIDAIKSYEMAIGIDHSATGVESDQQFPIRVSETDIKSGKERWDEFVRDLFDGAFLQDLLKKAKAKPKVKHAASKDQPALPPTDVDYFSRSPAPQPFRLNPSASSFVPLGSPSTTPSATSSSSSTDFHDPLNSFSFPSLHNTFPSKVYQEHVNNLPSRSRTSSSDSSSMESTDQVSNDFLPHRLIESANQRRRPVRLSRTRAIVDQLRSLCHQEGAWTTPGTRAQGTSPDFSVGNLSQFNKSRLAALDGSTVCPTTPPLTEEDLQVNNAVGVVGWSDGAEGWTIPPVTTSVDPETKRSRSKELLMTLRRRTDSLTSSSATAASLSAARSPDVTMSPVSYETESFVESPESIEVRNTETLQGHRRSISNTNPRHESRSTHSRDSYSSHTDLMSTTPFHQTNSPQPSHTYVSSYNRSRRDSRTHSRNQSYSQTCSPPTHYPVGYYQNTNSAVPYTLLGYPVSMSGISMTAPISVPTLPVTVAVGNPGVGMRASVPVPVPVQTLQYSTLMHLRIMQQMQVMRNSMGVNGGVVNASTGSTG